MSDAARGTASSPLPLRIERVVYGGLGLARTAGDEPHARVTARFVPFTLPGELVEAADDGGRDEMELVRVLESSAGRVEPGCPHFGVCGGCHLQMGSYAEQLRIKRDVLDESLQRAGVQRVPEIETHAGEPWAYRNRIRLHILKQDGRMRLGYRERESKAVFAARICPIAAPLLWRAAEAMLSIAESDTGMEQWLRAADEVELFCDEAMMRLQVTLLVSDARRSLPRGSFERAMQSLQAAVPGLAAGGVVRVHPRTREQPAELAAWGAAGIAHEVNGERYWVPRGGFFQVNRYLVPTMVELVCGSRSGALAWDLFAGVGLFARVLARSFERITAVEANPAAARELSAALRRLGAQHSAVKETTVEFLRQAAMERDRPELIVLDPPRAGAGREVCDLLLRVAPREMVYVSCDPMTLARDLAQLQAGGYQISGLHLVDLFPQTYHQEAVVNLRRRS